MYQPVQVSTLLTSFAHEARPISIPENCSNILPKFAKMMNGFFEAASNYNLNLFNRFIRFSVQSIQVSLCCNITSIDLNLKICFNTFVSVFYPKNQNLIIFHLCVPLLEKDADEHSQMSKMKLSIFRTLGICGTINKMKINNLFK